MGAAYRSPHGQSMMDVATLHLEWLLDTVIQIEAEVPADAAPTRLLVVGHGNGIKSAYATVTRTDPACLGEIRNTALTVIDYDPRRANGWRTPWSARCYNAGRHLMDY